MKTIKLVREKNDKDRPRMKKVIGIAAVLFLLGSAAMLFYTWQGNLPDTLYACRIMFLVILVFAILIGMTHDRASRGMDNRKYTMQLFCGRNLSGNRKAYLDYARVLAMVMVILTHACSMSAVEEAALWKTNLLLVCTGIGLVCNPLYVMISGALLLSAEKEESPGTFYFKRFIKVVVPLVLYYGAGLYMSGQISLIPPRNLKEGALQILAGASDIVPHYWLIYVVISLYLTAPFLRIMVKNLKDSYITVLFFLILAEESLAVYLPLTGVQIGFTLDLASWEGVFLLGYIIAERRTKMIERIVIFSGTISAVVVAAISIWDISLKDYVCNTAPVMVLFAGAVLILLSKLENVRKGKISFVVLALSKYNYSIMLLHWYGLFYIVWDIIGIHPLRFGCIGGIVLTVLTTVIVCFILGFAVENTVVLAVQEMIIGLRGALKRIGKK